MRTGQAKIDELSRSIIIVRPYSVPLPPDTRAYNDLYVAGWYRGYSVVPLMFNISGIFY